MTFKVSLGQYQLAVSFGRRRGRPQKFSNILRQVLENKKIRQIFGINLMAAILLTGIVAPPISAFTDNSEMEITAIASTAVPLVTERSVRIPVDSFQLTQGYHLFHRAIDLKEITGAPVYPIMEGRVEEVIRSRFAYGNYVVIDHGSGFRSLYAHLAKIVVEKGEEVDKNTVLGTVGSSGWTTGSHLHLEVWDNDRPFNPLTILK